MRMLTNEELDAVAGGYADNPETPEPSDSDFATYDSFFADYGMTSAYAGYMGTASKSVGSLSDAAELVKSITDALPKGSVSCKISASGGGNDDQIQWSVECQFTIVRK